MLSIKECRTILGEEANKLTDEEIQQIRAWLSTLADIAIEAMEAKK